MIALDLFQAHYQVFMMISAQIVNLVLITDYQLIFRFFECKKNYKKEFNKELIKRFANIYEFCYGDINKFILLLR